MTNTPEKGGTPAQPTEDGHGSGVPPTPVSDVVGESIRRRYAGSPGLIDLGVSRRLMSRLFGFGRQRVPLLDRVLARSIFGAGEGSLSPLTLYWGSPLWWPHQPEVPVTHEPAAARGQTAPSGDTYPSMPHPSAPGGRPALQLTRENLEISTSKAVPGSADAPMATPAPVVVKPLSSSETSTLARQPGTSVQPLGTDPAQVPAAPIGRSHPEQTSAGRGGPSQAANVPAPAQGEARAATTLDSPSKPASSGSIGRSQGANVLSTAPDALPVFRTRLPASGLPVRPGPRGLLRLSEKIWRAAKLGLVHRRTESSRSRLDPGPGDYITAPHSILALFRASRSAPEIPHAPAARVSSQSSPAEGLPGWQPLTRGVAHPESANPPVINRTRTQAKSILPSLSGHHPGNPPGTAPGAMPLPSSASPGDIYRFAHVESPQPRPGSAPVQPPVGQKNIPVSAPQESASKPAPKELTSSGSGEEPSSFPSRGDGGESKDIQRAKSEPITNTPPPQPASRPDPAVEPVTKRGEAESSAAVTTHAGTSESTGLVARVVQAFVPQRAMQTGSAPGWFPFPFFRRLAGISRWADRATPDVASAAPGVDRSDAAATLGGSALPRSGSAPGVTPPATASRNSWLGLSHGSIWFPVFRNPARGSTPGTVADSPLTHAAPVRQTISRAEIQPSTGTILSQVSADHSKVPSSTESSTVEPSSTSAVPLVSLPPSAELSPSLVLLRAQDTNQFPGTAGPLAPSAIGSVSTIYRALHQGRPSSHEMVARSLGRPAFAAAPFAPTILLSLNAPGAVSGMARPGAPLKLANAASAPVFNRVVEAPVLPSIVSRTEHDHQDHRGARAAIPGSERSPESEAGWIGSAPIASPFRFMSAARAALLSRSSFADPAKSTLSLTAAPSAGIGAGFAPNQTPFDLPLPHAFGSAGPHSEQASGTGSEPRSVLSFNDLPGAMTRPERLSGSWTGRSLSNGYPALLRTTAVPPVRADRILRLSEPDARSGQQALSFPVYRAAEASGYFSPVVARTGISLRVSEPDRGDSEPAARVLASRQSPVWRATGSSPAHGSGPADSLVLLQGGRGPGSSGAESPTFSSPDLPLASTVLRSAGNELSRAASQESSGGPGELQSTASVAIPEVGLEGPTTAAPSPTGAQTGLDIEELVDRVTKRLLRQLSIERERKGFTPWL